MNGICRTKAVTGVESRECHALHLPYDTYCCKASLVFFSLEVLKYLKMMNGKLYSTDLYSIHPSLLGFLKDGPGKSENFKNVASLETIRDLPHMGRCRPAGLQRNFVGLSETKKVDHG